MDKVVDHVLIEKILLSIKLVEEKIFSEDDIDDIIEDITNIRLVDNNEEENMKNRIRRERKRKRNNSIRNRDMGMVVNRRKNGHIKAKITQNKKNKDSEITNETVEQNFTLESYSISKFKKIKTLHGLHADSIISAITGKYILSKEIKGKSGSALFFTEDFNFVIKTIRKAEKNTLLNILDDYILYLENNPHSLLLKFFGLYKITMGAKKKYFIIMNNILPNERSINELYDLKGSHYKRITATKTIYKDLDWYLNDKKLFLLGKKAVLVDQIQRDVNFLLSKNLMDYSIVIGISSCNSKNKNKLYFDEYKDGIWNEKKNKFYGKRSTHNIFNRDFGGYSSEIVENEEIYYIGIIDILTQWNWRKRIEYFISNLCCVKNGSCTNSNSYAIRFVKMISNLFFSFCKET
ncbi:Phosphatidylinositol-4-phosphate 5-kinase [Spraguea lophii 42_110]|uniref:Phosphatidylinositol-4-phosphate 5-kinase n=1 Tax=Spraguea lophii (strain 42_110) TaxID=1358809 RepID=S7XLJ8_SPRLO|nr:Phosphatidylinositol-4-phosphate 5-kinase [Spraguea lophii 42_110]